MTPSLHDTNDMLRALGLNVPKHDDRIFDPDFDHLSGYHDDNEPTVMDAAGWDDNMEVDLFMNLPLSYRFDYAAGMGYRDAGTRA